MGATDMRYALIWFDWYEIIYYEVFDTYAEAYEQMFNQYFDTIAGRDPDLTHEIDGFSAASDDGQVYDHWEIVPADKYDIRNIYIR